MEILETIACSDTKDSATRFAAILSVDLGVGCEVVAVNGGHNVLADDGRAIRFIKS